MAVVQSYAHSQIRPPNNKEADWSGICETVLGQYGLDDDVFGLDAQQRESSISDQSSNLFDFSMSSGQSNHTTGTSPDPAWAEMVAMTQAQCEGHPLYLLAQQQPQAKQSHMQWERTVDNLEHAAEINARQHKLRASKSHPEFLSLGGNPSPPAVQCVPCPVPDQSLSVPRTRPHDPANGKKRSTSQLRSVSRGRPQGIAKNNSNTTMSTIRKRSISPVKMMTPTRYRPGYQEWADKMHASPTKYALRVPTHALPESPPSSGQLLQQDFAAFGSPTTNTASALLGGAYDSELSPLTTNFQQARLHTPDASPFFTGAGQQSYLDSHVAYQAPYAIQTVPLNDTSLASNRIGSFDFGFTTASSTDSWSTTSYQTSMPEYSTALATQGVYGGLEQLPVHQIAYGLGISCDTATLYPPSTPVRAYALSSDPKAAVPIPPTPRSACYPPVTTDNTAPTTPRKQSTQRSTSPPLTEPRSRRGSAGNGVRRASKHRRTKSTTSVPRHAQAEKSGFVNYTPDDSNKILSGVAPSGSSKTKARREKEAADRRRKLSMAAMKAVQDAGGDVEALTSTGLIESM